MNNNFVLFDKNSNIDRNAQSIVKFSFNDINYLVYSVDENEHNSQIFVSKLVVNSEGNSFIDDISTDEKGKLSNIVYNIVILLPSDFEKGSDFDTLVNNLFNKFSVKLLNGLPELQKQEYISNCSIAITSRILVDNAIKLFGDKLKSVNEDDSVEIPMWTSPVEVTAPTPVDVSQNNLSEPEVVLSSIPVQENNEPVLNIEEKIVPSVDDNIIDTPVVDNVSDSVVAPDNLSQAQEISEVKSSDDDVILPNPQAEKLAIVSDPSLGIGITQPNVMQNKKAGFANTKYVVIGTICLVLAIGVIVAAYFLIKNIG